MTSLLDLRLVRYMDIADIAEGMVSSMDLSGPVDIVDSALALCSAIVLRKGQENALVAAETADRFLNWLFHVWRPSQSNLVSRCSRLTCAQVISTTANT